MARHWPHYFRKAGFAALWILPTLLAFLVVWKHSAPLPFWDEWNTPGAQLASWYRGTLTIAELCSQHNESRKLIPRLIYLPLFTVAGWNVQLALALVFGEACLLSVGLYKLARRTIRSPGMAALAFIVMNLLLFSPRQYENLLNDLQWETFAPGLALVLALIVNLSRRSLAWKTICNALLALLSTYTFANGMLVWLLAFPVATESSGSSRTKLFWRLTYILSGAVAIGLYFIGYHHPPLSPPTASLITDGPALVHFFLIWLGSLFRIANPTIAGGFVVVLFLSLAGTTGWLIVKGAQWKSHYPWLVLGAYTLISGAITAVARLGFSLAIAADARYTVFSVILHIAVVGLAFTVYEELRGHKNVERSGALLGAATAIVLLGFWTSTFTAKRRFLKKVSEEHQHLLLVLRWAEALPQNPELAWLSPYPEMPQTIHTLAEYDALRPRLVSKTLAQAVNTAPTAPDNAAGVLEQAIPDGNGRLLVKGSARMPAETRPADCVVLGWQTTAGWQPRWVMETKGDRFSGAVIASVPEGGAILQAYAIDLQRERVYALAGAINLAP